MKPHWKTLVCLLFMTCCNMFVSVVVMVVNDRLPDRKKYPPLPDVVLDNIRYIPWASSVSEYCLITLLVSFFLLMAIHKQRFVVMQRGFVITGVLYLVRSVCVFVTSIPVPDPNKVCIPYPESSFGDKISRAIYFYTHLGLKVVGTRTCGDYIFSGHTMMLTLLNLFINLYTPKSARGIHLASWAICLTGIGMIFLCKGHYTIDIVLAFIIAVQLCSLYHGMVSNKNIPGKKSNTAMRIFFPMFDWVESDNDDVIRNEIEWPFRSATTPQFKLDV